MDIIKKMRCLSIFLIIIFSIISFACADNQEVFIPIDRISDEGKIYTIEDFKSIGFKKSSEYNVEQLPEATSAFFGFIKNEIGESEDYEIRFYATHIGAVEFGTKYADNIVGEDACGKKDWSLWLENLNQRQQIDGGPSIMESMAGTRNPKYKNYVIYNNLILFCPGNDENDSLKKCTVVIEKLSNK